jgi:L-fuculose-phosphate aldolase
MIEARKIKEKLVEYGKKIAEKGLAVGAGGNISARVGDIVYLSPSGYAFEELVPEQYVGVNLQTGEVVDGDLKPTCEISMHLGCYLIRKDIQAVVHTHPPIATGLISAGAEIKPMFPDFVAYVGEAPVIDYVIPAGSEIREAVTGIIKEHNAVLLKNHGAVTVGANLKEAFNRAQIIEDAARSLMAALVAGKPRFLTKSEQEGIRNLEAEDYRRTLLKREE